MKITIPRSLTEISPDGRTLISECSDWFADLGYARPDVGWEWGTNSESEWHLVSLYIYVVDTISTEFVLRWL